MFLEVHTDVSKKTVSKIHLGFFPLASKMNMENPLEITPESSLIASIRLFSGNVQDFLEKF